MLNIVMITKNRDRLFYQSVRTLHDNTPSDAYTLTVIDDASKVSVEELPYSNMANWGLLRIVNSKGITGMARNLGIYWSEKYFGRGDMLYCSDDDLYFTPGWIDRLVVSFLVLEKKGVSVLGAWNHPYMQPDKKNMMYVEEAALFAAPHDAVSGASQLMRWSTYDKYGPFDAHAKGVGQSEDVKFCQDVITDGGIVASVYERLCFNAGVTNSLGERSPGADVMIAELEEAQKQYPDLVWS